MKILFDENLSRKLISRLSDLFPGSTHVALEGLQHASDDRVWDFARARGFVIVTADADFYQLAIAFGPPPKVIWLRGCNYPTATTESLIRRQAIQIVDFVASPDRGVLILRP